VSGPIILCDDGSEAAASAMRQARSVLHGDVALALHVWQPLSDTVYTGVDAALVAGNLVDELLKSQKKEAEAIADAAAGRARAAGFQASARAVEAVGPVWRAILVTAQAEDASVIVVGARGLSGLQHVLLGSVSEKVARHADRPVLVLHPPHGAEDGSSAD